MLNEETVSVRVPSGIPDGLVVAVDNSERLWRELHSTYTFTSVLAPRHSGLSQGEIHYRKWRVTAEPGVLLLMEPGETHVTKNVVGSACFRVLQLAPSFVHAIADEMGVSTPVHWNTGAVRDPRIVLAFERLHALIARDADASLQRATITACVRGLLSRYAGKRNLSGAVPPRFRRVEVLTALDYIQKNRRRRITLDELASRCGLSRFRLDQVFSAEVGLAPLQYQLELRMREARNLLSGGMRAVEVAYELGFYDQPQFTRYFKRSVGLAPSEYASAMRQAVKRRDTVTKLEPARVRDARTPSSGVHGGAKLHADGPP